MKIMWLALVVAATSVVTAQELRTPIQKVETAAQLRASTAEDRALADHFDVNGAYSLLAVGHVQLLIGRNESATPPLPPASDDSGDSAAAASPDHLQALVCNSAAIVLGQVVSSRAMFNRSETYLVTNYTVAVSEWLRPSGGPGTVQVAALGGIEQIGDRTISAGIASVPNLPFQTPVLLFVNRIPGVERAFGLHTPAVRIDGGNITAPDLPNGGETLAESPSLNAVLARLRSKNRDCRTP